MRFSIIAAASALAACVAAAPNNALYPRATATMSDAQATAVANNFKTLIASYSDAFANQTMTVGFEDYSDSVNELINNGCPNGPATLGDATFDSRASFEAGQGSQPAIPFDILNIWNNGHSVTLRWYSAQTPEIVTGIIVLEVKQAPAGSSQPWLIKRTYSEFNSGAWLVNLGIFVPSTCNSTSS